FAKPVRDGWLAAVAAQLEGEAGLGGHVVAFLLGEDAALGVTGVAADQPAGPADTGNADRAAAAVEGAAQRALDQVADHQDQAATALGEASERRKGAADALLGIDRYAGVEEIDEWIDDD